MRKLLIISFLLLIGNYGLGQKPIIYEGKDCYTYNSSEFKDCRSYNNLRLTLNNDSSFLLYRTYTLNNAVCIGCIDTAWVTGLWSLYNDTITLNSTYRREDFVSIEEYRTKGKDRVIVYDTPFHCRHSDKIIINDTLSISINCWNAQRLQIDTMTSLRFIKYLENCQLYEYDYKLHPYMNSDVFTINLGCKRTPKNYTYFKNVKFYKKNNRLIIINKLPFFSTENGFLFLK